MNGIVAAGHPLTVEAAIRTFQKGGTAFDAAIAAGFASTVTEPLLSGLGGGGFALVHIAREKKTILYDFFVNAPGLGVPEGTKPDLVPVDIVFKHTKQRFYIGMGSVAVPGVLKGLVECFRELCTLHMDDIIGPTMEYLKHGVEPTEKQRYMLEILRPILFYTPYGREIYDIEKRKRLYNPLLLEFLKNLTPSQGIEKVYNNPVIEDAMKRENGILTLQDMDNYRVLKREPLRFKFKDHYIVTNPSPSFGGELLKKAFEGLSDSSDDKGEEGYYRSLVEAMRMMTDYKGITNGTTHISIMDKEGNAVSMTLSNGTGSGCFFPDTGIMLNNMMGEDDLHPQGFFTIPPGQRVGSMMSPTMLMKHDKVEVVLGSGGSKRIRTALLQVILNLLVRNMNVREAVEAPRIHLDDEDVLQIEPDLRKSIIEYLKKFYKTNLWEETDLYFGGVNVVTSLFSGWGDPRRDGSCKEI